MGRMSVLAAAVVVGGVVAWQAPAAQAVILTNFNTSVTVADVGVNPGHNITGWNVDGVNQYVSGAGSWFYRVGNGPVVSLDTAAFISSVVTAPSANPFDFSPTTLTTTFDDRANGLQFTMQYQVSGGRAGSGSSTIMAQLTAALIGPSTGTALSIYELNDLGLGANDVNDIVMPSALEEMRKVNQSAPATLFGEFGTFRLRGTGTDLLVSDPTHRQAGLSATVTAAVGNGLLNDTPPAGVSIGPADVAYAYQYEFVLVSGTPLAERRSGRRPQPGQPARPDRGPRAGFGPAESHGADSPGRRDVEPTLRQDRLK